MLARLHHTLQIAEVLTRLRHGSSFLLLLLLRQHVLVGQVVQLLLKCLLLEGVLCLLPRKFLLVLKGVGHAEGLLVILTELLEGFFSRRAVLSLSFVLASLLRCAWLVKLLQLLQVQLLLGDLAREQQIIAKDGQVVVKNLVVDELGRLHAFLLPLWSIFKDPFLRVAIAHLLGGQRGLLHLPRQPKPSGIGGKQLLHLSNMVGLLGDIPLQVLLFLAKREL